MHYHGWPSDIFLRVCERSYSWSWNYATVTTIRRREQCKIFQSSSGGGTSKVVWNLLAFCLHKSADSSLSKIVFQQTNTIVKCWEVTKVIISRKKRSLCSAKTLWSGLFTRSANNEDLATFCACSPRWITKHLNEGQRVEQGRVIVRWQWRNDTLAPSCSSLCRTIWIQLPPLSLIWRALKALRNENLWKLFAAS